MASTYHADIQALYVAYFNRPADYLGLDFWEKAIENAVAAAGSNTAAQAAAKAAVLAQISEGFAASDEYLDVYGGLPTEEVIGQVYQNLFGHAPDLEGLVFWVNAVRAGHVTVANAVTSIAAGAQGTDLEAFQNKVAAATAFSNEFDTGEEVLAYNGEEALTAAKAFIAGITTDATLEAALADIENQVAIVVDAGTPEAPVVQHTLTAGIDTIPGTASNDVITGIVGDTFSALDTINGGAGSDQLVINMVANGTVGSDVSVSNVELATVRSAGTATVTTTSWTGLEAVAVVQATAATVTAGSSTDVTVTGATGAVVVQGGADVTVAATTANQAVTVGNTTGAAGAVSITHAEQGTGGIIVGGGTNVTITSTDATTGAINIGQGAVANPSGAITVTTTGAAMVAAETAVRGAINIDGGTTVTVNQTATASDEAALDAAATSVTQSAVTVNGGSATTTVTVNQTKAVAGSAAVAAVDGAIESNVITFAAVTSGQTVTVGGLMFTASKDLTAAQVAAAFANLSAGAVVGSAPTANGIYSGTLEAGFVSGAVTTANGTSKVTVSSTTESATDLTVAAGTGITAVANTPGAAGSDAEEGVLTIIGGAVDINGHIDGADKIATVSLNGYGAGSAVDSDALTTLNLANSAQALTVDNAVATTLALGLNGITGGADLTLGGAYTTLNISATGANSSVDILAANVKTLAVSGDKTVTIGAASTMGVTNLTVTGAAGVSGTFADATSFNASGTSGKNTITVDGTKAVVTGGSGADSVTLSTANPTKAISLGAGDDTLTLAVGTSTSTSVLNGGEGTDTLSLVAADAATNSATETFETKFEGFEKVKIAATTAATTVNLANLDDISYVIAGSTTAGALNLDGMAANGTLELTAAGTTVDVDLTDATGTSDVFNIVTKAEGTINYGTVDVAGVETVNISVIDTDTTTTQTATLTLADAAAKTVVLSGGAVALNLDAGVTALTTVNGSALTGKLTYATNGAATGAQTVTGGAGSDLLTANRNADVLIGNAGNDTLIAKGDLNVLTGGAGADTFDISDKTSNVNGYATITDLAAGDKIKFETTAAKFTASKVTLADTAVFQDYANAAIALSDAGDVVWFQFGGNTYVVQNIGNSADTTFTNNEDIIVKITGAVDLSTASFSSSADILLIGAPGA